MIKRAIAVVMISMIMLSGCTIKGNNENSEKLEEKSATNSSEKVESTVPSYKIEPEKLIEDLDEWIKTVEEVHPNPYAYIEKDKFYKEYEKVKKNLNKPMNKVEFYKEIAPLCNLLGDGHTQIFMNDNLNALIKENIGVFPAIVEVRDGKIFNVQSIDEGVVIPESAEILSINGVESRKIVGELKKYESGEKDNFKEIRLETDFQFLLWLHYGFKGEFKVDYSYKNKNENISIIGVGYKEIYSKLNERYNKLSYRYSMIDDDICYLDFNAFNNYNDFESMLKNMFNDIDKNNIENLIIDIRDNGGGNSSLGDLLFSYLYNEPFTQYSKIHEKLSEQCKNTYASKDDKLIGTVRKQDIKPVRYIKGYEFKGRIVLLTNRYSFSSATDFAALINDYGRGIIIGEETGGIASSYGDVLSFILPNTGQNFGVSYRYFVRPNGAEGTEGVLADYEVIQSVEDKANGKDTVLNFAVDYIRNKYDSDESIRVSKKGWIK